MKNIYCYICLQINKYTLLHHLCIPFMGPVDIIRKPSENKIKFREVFWIGVPPSWDLEDVYLLLLAGGNLINGARIHNGLLY